MAKKVYKNLTYRILKDDYRKNFAESYKPYKILHDGTRLYKCVYCGKIVALGKEYKGQPPLEVDHIIPKTRLGAGLLWNPNRPWNLAPSCKSCNTSKSNWIDHRIIKGFINKNLKIVTPAQSYQKTPSKNQQQTELFTKAQPAKQQTVNQETPETKAFAVALICLSPLFLLAAWTIQTVLSILEGIFKFTFNIAKNTASLIITRVLTCGLAVYLPILGFNWLKTGDWLFAQSFTTMFSGLTNLLNFVRGLF